MVAPPVHWSIREKIILAIVAALDGGDKPSGLTIHRERTRPIQDDQLPAILVYSEDDAPTPVGGQVYKSPLVERQLVIYLEHRAQGSIDDPPDAALDPLIVWSTKTMVGNEKFVVTGFPDGLATGVVEGKTAWMSRQGDKSIAAASTQWIVKYRTSRLDPTLRT
jgi:hypothetical protein